MTLNSWIFSGACLLFSFQLHTQHSEDLGRAKPFLIEMKGRIYAFKLPRTIAPALKEMGMPETMKVDIKGFEFTQPIAPNTDETGGSKNRRVDIKISLL
jgi:hypothetical protein